MSKRKQKKSSLKPLLLLLLLTAALLIVSTYAWFTSNKTVMVSSMDVNIQASQGFQLSTDGENWKTVLQVFDITNPTNYANNKNHVASDMDPFSTAATRDAANGYVEMFKGLVSSNPSGDLVLSAAQGTDDKTTVGGYTAFDLFFKTNNAIDLYLEPTAGVSDIGSGIRAGKGMENAARVAFAYQGLLPAASISASDPSVGSQARAMQTTTDPDGQKVTIWEPNSDAHTANAISDIFNIWGSSVSSNILTAPQLYDGIFADIPAGDPTATPTPIPYTLLTDNTALLNPNYFKNIQADRVSTLKARTSPDSLHITLQPGITKFRVYMWLEGQDWDCYDSASGSNIQWNLILSAQPAVTP